jgi:hypothetical protein
VAVAHPLHGAVHRSVGRPQRPGGGASGAP